MENAASARSGSPRTKEKPTIVRIRNAARKVFYQKGFFAASVEEIAEAAGVSRATVYLHFRSKDEMLLELMRQDLGFQLEIYAELVSVKRVSFTSVRAWLMRLRGDLDERRLSLNLFWAGSATTKDYLDPVYRHRDDIIAILGRRFAGFDLDALARADREPQRIKCYMMLFMIEGTTVQLIEGSTGPNVKASVDALTRTLMHFMETGNIVMDEV